MTCCPKQAVAGSWGLCQPQCGRTPSQTADKICLMQVPKPPKKDFYKLMNKDKIILRFGCRFVETATHKLSPADR